MLGLASYTADANVMCLNHLEEFCATAVAEELLQNYSEKLVNVGHNAKCYGR